MANSIYAKIDVDPELSSATGRNGHHKVKTIVVSSSGCLVNIDCIGRSGKMLNAGITIPRDKASELAEALLGDRNS
jgi:hypothetical protein